MILNINSTRGHTGYLLVITNHNRSHNPIDNSNPNRNY